MKKGMFLVRVRTLSFWVWVSVVGLELSVIVAISFGYWFSVMEKDISRDLAVLEKVAETQGKLKSLTFTVSPSDKLTQERPRGTILEEVCVGNSPALVYQTANRDQACLERYCFHPEMNYWALMKECRDIPASEYKAWWWKNMNTLEYFGASTPEQYRETSDLLAETFAIACLCGIAFLIILVVLAVLDVCRDGNKTYEDKKGRDS